MLAMGLQRALSLQLLSPGRAILFATFSTPALLAERAGSGAEDEEPASPISQMDDSAGSAATAVDAAVVGILDTDALRRSMAGGSPAGLAHCKGWCLLVQGVLALSVPQQGMG